jgi:hypothetical protein
MIFVKLFVNSDMSAFLKACTTALAESRGKGVHSALIILALHVVLIFFHWVGNLYVTLNLLLSGASHKFI